MAASPNIDIVQLWIRNQKSASVLVPGVCGEFLQATDPKIEARRVKMLITTIRTEFHYPKLASFDVWNLGVSYFASFFLFGCLFIGRRCFY